MTDGFKFGLSCYLRYVEYTIPQERFSINRLRPHSYIENWGYDKQVLAKKQKAIFLR